MLNKQLLKIKNGHSKTINEIEVFREDDRYIIAEETYDLNSAIEYINDKGTKPKPKDDYSNTIFMMFDGHKHISSHQCKDKSEYLKLIELANTKRLVIYYSNVEYIEGVAYAVRPFIVDFTTVENLQEKSTEDLKQTLTETLTCPYCDISLSSTSGRTLHVKNKHPSRHEEYLKIVNSEQSEDDDDLGCPYCDKVMNSKSGLANHINNKHPTKHAEYLKSEGLEVKPELENKSDLKCPHCKKTMNSKSGLTNHINSKHSDKINN